MRLLVLQFAPDVYRVTLRARDGTLLMRASGPPGFCLEQLAAGLGAPRRPWWGRLLSRLG